VKDRWGNLEKKKTQKRTESKVIAQEGSTRSVRRARPARSAKVGKGGGK